jgi:hypothetical protein
VTVLSGSSPVMPSRRGQPRSRDMHLGTCDGGGGRANVMVMVVVVC